MPNTFHFVYGLRPQTEPFPLAHLLCLRSCRAVNQPDEIVLHLHHEPWGRYWDLVRDDLTIVPVEPVCEVDEHDYDERLVPARYRYAHHADFLRLDALVEQGGVYADIDTIFVAPLPSHLFEQPFVIGREPPIVDERTGERRPSLCNAFLMSEPGSAFARTWRDRMAAALDGWSHHSTLLPQELAEAHPDQVHIEPERTFFAYPSTPDGLRRLFEGCETDLDGVASIHLWSHLWWEEDRVDFSTFHGSLLTEHFVRTVDTTYGLLARPHLPPFDPTWFARSR